MLTKLAHQNLLGWGATGDIAGYTVYYSERGKTVVFPRSPPLNPPTPAQEANRDRFRAFAEWWNACPTSYKTQVERMCCRAGLRITGYNFACYLWCSGDSACWHTVCLQAKEFPAEPPFYGPP